MAKIGIDLRMYSSQFTGIGRYCYELLENLLKVDDQNQYVCFFNEPQYSEFVEAKKGLIESGKVVAVKVEAPHYSAKEQVGFLQAIKKAEVDLMHFTHFNAPIFYKGKCVVTIHDLTLSFFPGKKMTKFYHRWGYYAVVRSVLKHASKIIAVSKNTEDDIHHLYPFTKDKTTVVYEAVGDEFKVLPIEKVAETMGRLGIDREYLLYTGVHRNHKNVVGLIAAFALLKKEYGFEGYLVLTGKEDPHYPEVRETIAKFGLEKSVKLVGLVPENDLIALYNGASVYAYPSFYEGFGLPALEAFACDTPVCASNQSCIPEICMQAATFFDPKNIEDMAQKLNQALTDDALRAQLITAGQNRMKAFSWEKMAKETLDIYNDALN